MVQQSNLSVTRTLARLDIHKSTFYNWLGRYHDGGLDALDDKKPQPSMAWNKVPTEHRQALIDFALRETDLSPRELAVRYTDEHSYFVSESTVYRLHLQNRCSKLWMCHQASGTKDGERSA